MPAGWLLLALSVYLVPISLGYAWNTLGARSVAVPGIVGGGGRLPDSALTVEWFGTSAIYVPFEARVRSYLLAGELPLWNPYQGLGEVFAAQGEGSPYSPLAMLRALVPNRWGNLVSVAEFFAAAAFTVSLLRNIGLSRPAALAGGAAFVLSGALSLHIPRGNIVEQLCLLPPLIWAAERAIRLPTGTGPIIVLAVATGLVALGGFIQIAVVSLMVAVCFLLFYAVQQGQHWQDRLMRAVRGLGSFGLGLVLGAVHLLPVAEAIRISHNPRGTSQAFIQTPVPNLLAFFAPGIFGQPFQSWLPGTYPDVVDWNNLYGTASLGIGLLAVGGLAALTPADGRRRWVGWFFGLVGLVLLLRYGSSPLVAGVNVLPVLAQQTPKHANGVTVFCLVVAAAIGIDAMSARRPSRSLHWIGLSVVVLLSALVTFIGLRGGFAAVGGPLMDASIALTATVVLVLLAAMVAARRWERLNQTGRATLLGTVLVAELALYVPLGNSDLDLVGWRVGLFIMTAAAGVALAMGIRWLAIVGFGATILGYALVVAVPAVGLPGRFDVATPPAYMTWLRAHAGDEFRTFGIVPNYSSIGQIQDLGTIGPLVPMSFASFVDMAGSEAVRTRFRASNHLFLAVPTAVAEGFDLKAYAASRPIFDWLGVRYLVLDRDQFRQGGRIDHLELMQAAPDLTIAYEDQSVIILESPTAQPKATFTGALPAASSRAAIVDALKADPGSVRNAPRVVGSAAELAADGATGSVEVTRYQPNRVQLVAETTGPGWVILKDGYAPGWRATVDGRPAPVLEVNAMVRGVPVSVSGRHAIELTYRPPSVLAGMALSAAALLLLAVCGVAARLPATSGRYGRMAAYAVGSLLLALFLDASSWAFTGRSVVAATLAEDAAPRSERLAVGSAEVVRYLTDAPPGIIGPDPQRLRVGVGQLALLGSSGQLIRVADDGREVIVTGDEGQTIQVAGVGLWDTQAGRLQGLPAVFRGGRWIIDQSAMQPVPVSASADAAADPSRLFGLTPVTRTAGFTIQQLTDRSGPFVRVQATRRSPDLTFGLPLVQLGAGSLPDTGPVSVRAEVRARTALRFNLGLLGLMIGGDKPADVRVSRTATGGWDTLVLRTPLPTATAVPAASPGASLVLGVDGVAPGDWFDVRAVSLFAGTLP